MSLAEPREREREKREKRERKGRERGREEGSNDLITVLKAHSG